MGAGAGGVGGGESAMRPGDGAGIGTDAGAATDAGKGATVAGGAPGAGMGAATSKRAMT